MSEGVTELEEDVQQQDSTAAILKQSHAWGCGQNPIIAPTHSRRREWSSGQCSRFMSGKSRVRIPQWTRKKKRDNVLRAINSSNLTLLDCIYVGYARSDSSLYHQ